MLFEVRVLTRVDMWNGLPQAGIKCSIRIVKISKLVCLDEEHDLNSKVQEQ